MDFVLEGDHRSMHVRAQQRLSPAFTCSLPFARYVCDHIENALGQHPIAQRQPISPHSH